MPIYEYQCQKCGTFEATQRITEKPLAKCPTCRARVKKLISNTSFQLKGTGWYVTDYARKAQDGAKKENGSKSGAETKSESKSEPKKEPTSTSNDKPSPASSSSSSTPA
ncbi:MAG: FmdB family zinc ribbon protein [Candidatus Binatia bacterium]